MPIKINGLNTGSVTLSASATGGDVTLNLPNANGTVATTSYADTAPGLQYITGQTFTAVSSVSVNNCFTSTYDVYRMVLRLETSGIDCWLRMRVGGVDESGSNYRHGRYFVGVTTSVAAGNTNNQTDTYAFIGAGDSNGALSVVDIGFPALAKYTRFASHNSAALLQVVASSLVNTTVYDGFTLLPTSSTMTGNLRIYGYRNL